MIRTLTFNVGGQSCDLRALAALINEVAADFTCLQELTPGAMRRLARATGMRAAGSALLHVRGVQNAVLWRGRARATGRASLPRRRGAPRRSLAWAVVDGTLVASTHLGLSRQERLGQAEALLRVLPERRRVVLCGDLNENPGGAAARALGARFRDAGAAAGPTFPAHEPAHRIDVVLCSADLEPVDATVLPAAAGSDHLPLLTALR